MLINTAQRLGIIPGGCFRDVFTTISRLEFVNFRMFLLLT